MARPDLIAMAAAVAMLAHSSVAEANRPQSHEVSRGESLWSIARAYGCEVDDLKRANSLDGTVIYPGQRLAVPACGAEAKEAAPDQRPAAATTRPNPRAAAAAPAPAPAATAPAPAAAAPAPAAAPARAVAAARPVPAGRPASGAPVIHRVARGDTLISLARLYDTSVADLMTRNRLASDRLLVGQEIRILPGGGGSSHAIPGQSVGSPHSGRLVNATQLPAGRGYHRRRPERAWGANHTIYHIRRAVAAVRSRHPQVHELAIGDISARTGGNLAEHRSHQTGRDVDIGLYFTTKPAGYPQRFVPATETNLHFEATWLLLETFADTADSPTGVERMFLAYEVQGMLHRWAKERGIAADKLDRVFQYPHGESAARGLVRHEAGHDGHFHVRFKCPPGAPKCE